MRHVWAIGMACLAVLIATGSIEAGLMPRQANPEWERKVATLPAGERNLIHRIDVADCQQGVVAGRERLLAASGSREERRELARQTELVSRFCECRFESASQLLTRRQFASLWVESDALADASSPAPGPTTRNRAGTEAAERQAELDRIVRDCAEAAGLRALPEETGPLRPEPFRSGTSFRMT